jgi:hypothetical protein
MITEERIKGKINYLKLHLKLNKNFLNEERIKIIEEKIKVLEWVLK